MARIYFRRYVERIEAGEITLTQAVELAQTEVPAKWRAQVIELLNEYGGNN